MYVYLSKVLPLFVLPVSVVLLLCLLALLTMLRKRRRAALLCLGAAIAVLWTAAMPVVANALYAGLESQYPPRPLQELPASDCMVVLGGAVGAALPPRVDIELNEAVDRVYRAAQLFRAGKAGRVIVSAGNQPWSRSPVSEAELIRGLLVEWGVPPQAILLEGSSRNTRENAVYTKNLVDAIHCRRILLVTSAAHMPRAVATFHSAGLEVDAVSTDVHVTSGERLAALDFLPSAAALATTTDALREWLGLWVYRYRGWN